MKQSQNELASTCWGTSLETRYDHKSKRMMQCSFIYASCQHTEKSASDFGSKSKTGEGLLWFGEATWTFYPKKLSLTMEAAPWDPGILFLHAKLSTTRFGHEFFINSAPYLSVLKTSTQPIKKRLISAFFAQYACSS